MDRDRVEYLPDTAFHTAHARAQETARRKQRAPRCRLERVGGGVNPRHGDGDHPGG